jgi:hypothetical protein
MIMMIHIRGVSCFTKRLQLLLLGRRLDATMSANCELRNFFKWINDLNQKAREKEMME